MHVLGLVVAMLALAGRLASGTVAIDPWALDEASALLAAAVPCEAQAHDPGRHGDSPLKPGPDQAVLALVSILSQPSPVLTPELTIPPPRQAPLPCPVALPPARAPPPARLSGAALPRGPPVLA